jgi:hypothetical protein
MMHASGEPTGKESLKMASYTIEDIEMLRKKSGMTYQEAVALLDYHDGNLARALIDLEKSGRLKEDEKMESTSRAYTGHNEAKQNETKQKALNILQLLYRSRIKVSKGKTTVLNFSVLFGALCLIFAPHMTIFGFILSLILGYQFSFTKLDEEFASENLEKMVKNAAQNAKSSVSSAVQSFKDDKKGNAVTDAFDKAKETVKSTVSDVKAKTAEKPSVKADDDPAEALRKQTKEMEETMNSFFESNPAATTYHSAYSAAASEVPTIQIPVQAETKEGKVEFNDDQDGFSSVTVG